MNTDKAVMIVEAMVPFARKRRIGLYLFLSVFICVPAVVARAEVTAKDAWVRGMVPAQNSTGAFLTLTSTVDAKLVGVSSPLAKMAEIHETKVMGGANHMHEVESLALPAGKPVALTPGGHHVMLMGMAKPVKPGESVPLVLVVEEKGGKRVSLEVKAEVRPLAGR